MGSATSTPAGQPSPAHDFADTWPQHPRSAWADQRRSAASASHPEPTPSGPDSTRFEVCPPSLFPEDDSAPRSRFGPWWPSLHQLRDWLASGGLQAPAEPAQATPQGGAEPPSVRAARQAFVAALADLPAERAGGLAARAHTAGTLRELWHLRNELFTVVSITHCEQVAQDRIATLNRFFPVRAQGSTPRRHWPFAASPRHDTATELHR